MKSRGWVSLLLAAVVGLFGQPVDAAYTRIDTGLPAIESSLLQAPPPAVAEIPADAWIVESIIPLGHTADGQPLALISLLVPNSSLDEIPPTSTRAGPYAAPETHTRVFCIVQPPLGLEFSVGARVAFSFGAGITSGKGWNRYISDLQYTVGARYDSGNNVEAQIGVSVRGHGDGRGRTGSSNLGGTAGDIAGYWLLTYYKGDGSAHAMPQYTLNAHTVTPFDNRYDTSFTFGHTYNRYMWSSDDSSQSIDAFNVTSFLQYRNANRYAFYMNDSDSPLRWWKDQGRDRNHTAAALVGQIHDDGSRTEFAWDCFTGDFVNRNQRTGRYYDQHYEQQKLNRSEFLIRHTPANSSLTLTIGRSSPSWLNPQDGAHHVSNFWQWLWNTRLPGAPSVCGFFEFDGNTNPETFIGISLGMGL